MSDPNLMHLWERLLDAEEEKVFRTGICPDCAKTVMLYCGKRFELHTWACRYCNLLYQDVEPRIVRIDIDLISPGHAYEHPNG